MAWHMQNYPPNVLAALGGNQPNTQLVQKHLDENAKLIDFILTQKDNPQFQTQVEKCKQKLRSNLILLATLADTQLGKKQQTSSSNYPTNIQPAYSSANSNTTNPQSHSSNIQQSWNNQPDSSSYGYPTSAGQPMVQPRVQPKRTNMIPWNEQEHRTFVAALKKYGYRDLNNVAREIGTKTPQQVAEYLQLCVAKNQQRSQQQYNTNPFGQ
mmetsp:Transcript_21047/g.36108  ORF Transcript_21047/g.36108 Transcript_21047/m.36108 type:complete len:211 (+) Transcript_21047:1-633(+)